MSKLASHPLADMPRSTKPRANGARCAQRMTFMVLPHHRPNPCSEMVSYVPTRDVVAPVPNGEHVKGGEMEHESGCSPVSKGGSHANTLGDSLSPRSRAGRILRGKPPPTQCSMTVAQAQYDRGASGCAGGDACVGCDRWE